MGIGRSNFGGDDVKTFPLIRVNLASDGCGTMPRTILTDKTLPIQTAAPADGCGHCPQGNGDGGDHLGCHFAQAVPPAAPPTAPQLSGPADVLARLMSALAGQPGFEAGTTGLVRALKVQPGEVELQLTVDRRCGGAELSDTAFQTLRGLLPDTDIYVLNAR